MKIIYKDEIIGEIKGDKIIYINKEKGEVLEDFFSNIKNTRHKKLNDEDDLMVIEEVDVDINKKKAVLLELGFELQ